MQYASKGEWQCGRKFEDLYDSALWLGTFKDATTKEHLGRKRIRMETYRRDCNAHRSVFPSTGESSHGLLSTK